MYMLLTLVHARGYITRRVCGSVCQLAAMAASNGHKSETTSPIATKGGIGMESIAFSDVIQLKSLLTKREARKVTEMVQFSPKNVKTTADLHVRSKVPAGRKQGDEQILYGRLHASSSLASYRKLEKAKLTSC